jgi:alpha(1,3/1,4) fucosyltransferase
MPFMKFENDRRIKIWYSDFTSKETNKLHEFLDKYFCLEINNNHPDFLIYTVFGNEFLKYKDSVRIFYTAENLRPDFNLCDYAFSFDWLEFEDRHFRAPNFLLFNEWNDIIERKKSSVSHLELNAKKFCNFIYSHGNGHPFRDDFFHRLSNRKKVDSIGAHLRNTYEQIVGPHLGDWSSQKVNTQRKYKFSIAFENASNPGYTTEKLIHALAADTIPIYWGDPFIARTFNLNRIINLNELSIECAIERIIELDQNDEQFLDIVNQPFFKNNEVPINLTQPALAKKFDQIFSQPKDKAYRRNFYYWSERYEAKRLEEITNSKLYKEQLWKNNIALAIKDIKEMIPINTCFILVDHNSLQGNNVFADRQCVPFIERNGEYWGAPENDEEAAEEVERQIANGVGFIVITWSAFWYFDYYKSWNDYLKKTFTCILRNERAVIFQTKDFIK